PAGADRAPRSAVPPTRPARRGARPRLDRGGHRTAPSRAGSETRAVMTRGVEYKTDDEIRVMRKAGLVVAELHRAVREAAVPGATTNDLDAVAAGVIAASGATPNFLGYHGFPKTICTSVNEEVVHGIPSDRVLREGDLLS